MAEQEYFGLSSATEYLGIPQSALGYHVQSGHIEPVAHVNGGPLFLRGQLDEFIKQHVRAEGLTKKEIAEKYGVSPSLVSYYQKTGRLTPVGKRGRAWVFSTSDAEGLFGDD